jgi:hypothetical protein
MTWDDRVVRTADGYAIYEVYDDGGGPEARTEDPASPFGETLEELADDVRYYLAALQQPVLDDALFHRGRARPFGVDCAYTHQELQALFRLAHEADMEKGGHYVVCTPCDRLHSPPR